MSTDDPRGTSDTPHTPPPHSPRRPEEGYGYDKVLTSDSYGVVLYHLRFPRPRGHLAGSPRVHTRETVSVGTHRGTPVLVDVDLLPALLPPRPGGGRTGGKLAVSTRKWLPVTRLRGPWVVTRVKTLQRIPEQVM